MSSYTRNMTSRDMLLCMPLYSSPPNSAPCALFPLLSYHSVVDLPLVWPAHLWTGEDPAYRQVILLSRDHQGERGCMCSASLKHTGNNKYW